MLGKITPTNLSSFNTDFILKSNCDYCRHLVYFYQLRFLCSLLKIVLQFQSLHNSHTGHCYVMSLSAGKRLDVIITIMETVQCYVLCPQVLQKLGVRIFFRSLPSQKPTVKTEVLPNQILHYLQKKHVPRLTPQMWHETLFDELEASAYTCKWSVLCLSEYNVCHNAFLAGDPPRTPLDSSWRSPKPPPHSRHWRALDFGGIPPLEQSLS